MIDRELQLEALIGRKVLGPNGEDVGRLEEAVAELRGSECRITEFHAGTYAFFERLSALTIGRALLKLFGKHTGARAYRIPWAKLDLADPQSPRLLCPVSELEELHH
ncbi:MAG: hypothetical protein ACJ8AS_12720 [Hyphomicrobiales bacterium]